MTVNKEMSVAWFLFAAAVGMSTVPVSNNSIAMLIMLLMSKILWDSEK